MKSLRPVMKRSTFLTWTVPAEELPLDWDDEPPLDKYQSWYFDIGENELVRLAPVPDIKILTQKYNSRLARKRVRI